MMVTEKGKAWDVVEKVKKIKGVKVVHAVTGPYDVIAYVEVEDLSKRLKNIISKIHKIDEVDMTLTAIAVH